MTNIVYSFPRPKTHGFELPIQLCNRFNFQRSYLTLFIKFLVRIGFVRPLLYQMGSALCNTKKMPLIHGPISSSGILSLSPSSV